MASDAERFRPSRTSTYPVRDGNLVRPLVDGVPAFRRICDAVARAERRVWATIAFVDRTVVLPDGGTVFDLLDRAAARGLDVRVVFWRQPTLDPCPAPGWEHFPGNAGERAWLAERGSTFRARWDHLPKGCHHQKSWIVDAGEPGEVAFVGGINLDRMSMVDRGHRLREPDEHYHDVYVELAGPSASDVHHNFVQRWNEASERTRADGVSAARRARRRPGLAERPEPTARRLPRAGRPHAPRPRAEHPRVVPRGDRRGREWIYVENQFFFSHPIFERMDAALRRGVEVLVLVPGRPLPGVREERTRHPRLFAALEALARHARFALAGLAWFDDANVRHDVYVHSKLMIVDDAWMTVGSANLEKDSLERHTELNVACWDARVVHELRRELFTEHGSDAVSAPRGPRSRRSGRQAAQPLDASRSGLLVELDATKYAVDG
jgi:phosphatidylserine/phosphatidylglycerophosphate/cardiolipin synthase-like enzyme